MVIVEGPLAGGHLGFSEDQLEPFIRKNPLAAAKQMSAYDSEICKIIEVASGYGEKYGMEIPVVVAGGIDTPEKAEHYFVAGRLGNPDSHAVCCDRGM